MVTVITTVLDRGILPLTEITEWIGRFKNPQRNGKYQEDIVLEFNITAFLRSLYFRLIDNGAYAPATDEIKETLRQISHFSKDKTSVFS